MAVDVGAVSGLYPCLLVSVERPELLGCASLGYACFSSSDLAVVGAWVVCSFCFFLLLFFCFCVGVGKNRSYYVRLFDIFLYFQFWLLRGLVHYVAGSLGLFSIILSYLPVLELSLHSRPNLYILAPSPEIVVLCLKVF